MFSYNKIVNKFGRRSTTSNCILQHTLINFGIAQVMSGKITDQKPTNYSNLFTV